MKKALLAAILAAFAQSALAAVAGTSHDLAGGNASNVTKYGAAPASQTSCGFCHAVHNANIAFTGAPLWNRPTLSATWTMYDPASLTAGAAVNTNLQGPAANSLTCLTCHEGTATLGVLYSSGGANILTGAGVQTTMDPVATRNLVTGNDLSNDHPVSLTYAGGTGFQVISSSGTADANVGGLPLYGATFNRLECGTCHDPHESTLPKFLRIAPASICATCHTDK